MKDLKNNDLTTTITTSFRGSKMHNKDNSVLHQFLASAEKEFEMAESQTVSLTKLRNIFARVEETCKNDSGTALHFVAGLGFARITRALINHGYNIDAQNNKGITPLHMATLFGHNTICKLLLERGAMVDSIDKTGKTALHIATYQNKEDLVRLFLKFGANQMLRTQDNLAAAHIATNMNHTNIRDILRDDFAQKFFALVNQEAIKKLNDPTTTRGEIDRLKRAGFSLEEDLEPCNSPLKF